MEIPPEDAPDRLMRALSRSLTSRRAACPAARPTSPVPPASQPAVGLSSPPGSRLASDLPGLICEARRVTHAAGRS